MKVENYSVKDIAQVSDYLIRNLIKANISYVFIKSNEIHYNDKIIRLHYDPTKTNNDDRTLLLKILKETLEIEPETILTLLNPYTIIGLLMKHLFHILV